MMLSKSFLRGFGRGFSAPGLLFEPFSVRSDRRFDASVENAWKEVGRYLDDATAYEESRIGEKTDRPGKGRRRSKVPA